ncbi:MAG: penicillin-insensitive murein endopeptidase [Hyphomicrobiaceae bacterium]
MRSAAAHRLRARLLTGALALSLSGLPAVAQAPTSEEPPAPEAAPSAPAPAAPKPGPRGPEARKLFGAKHDAAPLAPRAIGFYSRGCLSGAKPLAIDGPNWQAMRLSRNRNWGHPELIALVEQLAKDAKAMDGWPGLLVGDLSQPRGGPMLTGHASHQIGLDADIWLTPMPNRRLTEKEREDISAVSMLGADGVLADEKVFTAAHARLIRRAATYPNVERILVHPGIKKALCLDPASTKGSLSKIRPFWGHHYHMHIRIACPKGSEGCAGQQPVGNDDGCGKEVDDWIALLRRPPRPVDPSLKPPPPKPQLTLEQLPAECRLVLEAGAQPGDVPAAAPARPRAPKGVARGQ